MQRFTRAVGLCSVLGLAFCSSDSVSAPRSYEEVTDLRAVDGPDPRTPKAIAARIEAMAGHRFRRWTEAAGLTYPPNQVELRAFKEERELEIWGRNRGAGKRPGWSRIATLPICALDDEAGTKLRQGDGKTPEGTYRSRALYPSRYFWMWMKLDPVQIDLPGIPGRGSAFRLCLDYPSATDRARSRQAGFKNPGGGICLHGNCVSSGCLSFTNRNFLAVFAFAGAHDRKRFGPLRVHIAPRR